MSETAERAVWENAVALKEATRLAVLLFEQHYRSDHRYASGSVEWKPLDDLLGVISQIDNMTAGLVRRSLSLALSDEKSIRENEMDRLYDAAFAQFEEGIEKNRPLVVRINGDVCLWLREKGALGSNRRADQRAKAVMFSSAPEPSA